MIEATTSLLMLVSAFYGTTDTALATNATQNIAPKAPIVQMQKSEQVSHDQPLTLEQYVRTYYKDTPLLAEIARCESTFRQLDKQGNIIRGVVNKGDVGVMQINEYYHKEQSEKLGYDIYTLEGNMGYAEHLFEKEGSTPWKSSSKCWGKYEQLAMK